MHAMLDHCNDFSVQIKELEPVSMLDLPQGSVNLVKKSKANYATEDIIIATGAHHRELAVPGENQFKGRGVSYCTVFDEPLFKGKKVVIVGGGNTSVISALFLRNNASDVTLVHRRAQLKADEALCRAL